MADDNRTLFIINFENLYLSQHCFQNQPPTPMAGDSNWTGFIKPAHGL